MGNTAQHVAEPPVADPLRWKANPFSREEKQRRELWVLGIALAGFVAATLLSPLTSSAPLVWGVLAVVIASAGRGPKLGLMVAIPVLAVNAAWPLLEGAHLRTLLTPDHLWNQAAVVAGALLGPQLRRLLRAVPPVAGRSDPARWIRRYAETLENVPAPVAIIAKDGTVLFRSRALWELLGSSIAPNIFMTLPAHDHPGATAMLARAFEGGQGQREQEVVTPDGRAIKFTLNYGPVTHCNRVVAAIIFMADITELRRLQSMRARFMERMVDMQEQERRRLARELHDLTSQSLASLLIGLRVANEHHPPLKVAQQLDELRALTSQAIDDIGRLARDLHPRILDDMGLAAAIRWYATSLGNRHGLAVEVETVGFAPGARLPLDIETSLYRVVQEALTNTARHACATTLSVLLEVKPQGVRIIIEDDGSGFVPHPQTGFPPETGGVGLFSIRERVELMGGHLTIESAPGAGTTLFVQVPHVPSAPSSKEA